MPTDPYSVFNFVIEVNGTQVGGFSEVAGLSAETETEDFREGGINDYVHKLAKLSKYSNLTLKRGITDRQELWQWHQDVLNGIIERRTVSVILQNQSAEEKWRWVFYDAYPVKWSSSDLSATGNNVAVESVELVHHGMKKT